MSPRARVIETVTGHVCMQVLIRRELEEAAKTLGDRVRQKDATCEVSLTVSCSLYDRSMHLLRLAIHPLL